MAKKSIKKQKKTDNIEFKFLPDTPLRADQIQEVHFGHIDIAENLKKVILKCPTPFTIGLFAKWGTGKTTIINILQEMLRKTNIACVIFDVWKHEGDALRRTFLKEITIQLKAKKYLSKAFKLSERLDCKISREFQGKFHLRKGWLCLLFGLIIAAIIGGILFHKFWSQAFYTYLSIVSGGSITAGFLIWILRQALTVETITSTTDRLQDPHEFETEFGRIIKKVASQRLLIIIDNLDRCCYTKAVELLSTIKTFLAKDSDPPNKCIFLIACDDKAIRKHLKAAYKMDPVDADEFLRKFFNTTQRIPDFIDTELHTYSEDLLKETKITQFSSPDVVSVITTAFRKNPRQIKQFINTLITHFLLAQGRENDSPPSIISKGTVTGHVNFLAKFLVIFQQFPDIYKIIIDNHLSSDKIEEFNFKEQGVGEEQIKKFQDFQEATSWVRTDDIRPFHYLRQSDEERKIPGINELKIALLDKKEDIVKEQISKLGASQVGSFEKIVISLINRNKTNPMYLGNVISSCLVGLKDNHKIFKSSFYDKIAGLLKDDKFLGTDLDKFEPFLIFHEVLVQCNERNKKGIIDGYIMLFDRQKTPKNAEKFIDEDYAIKLLKEFIKHRDWLSDSQKEKIRQTIVKSYYSHKFLSLFTDDSEVQKDFISGEAISNFVTTFSDEDIENKEISNKVEIIISLKDIITTKIVSEVITKFRDLLSTENSKSYRGQKENLINCIEDILYSFYKEIEETTDYDTIDSFTNIHIQGMNALGNFTEKRIFIYTCYRLLDILKDPRKTQVDNLIVDFFKSADDESIKFIFDKLNKNAKQNLIQKCESTFQNRVLEQQPIFNLLYPLAPKDIRSHWFTELISVNLQRAVEKLEELHYEPDDKVTVVNALLEKAQISHVEEKENLYSVVNNMECAKDTNLKKIFASQIKELLKNTDQEQQKCGYSALEKAAYLSEPIRRDITRGVIEWLRSLTSNNASQLWSIRSVLLNIRILPLTPQRDFIDFIFEKLIKSKSNITLGFEILSHAHIKNKIKRKDYSIYFDDILLQAKSEPNKKFREDMFKGLLIVLPKTKEEKIKTDRALSNAQFALKEAERNGWSNGNRDEFRKEVRILIVQITQKYGIDKKRFKNTRELLDRAIATDSSFSDFYHMKGLSYFWAKEYKEAVKWYEKAAELNPKYICTWGDMITCLFRDEKFNDTTEKIKLAIKAKVDENNLRSDLSKFKVNIDTIWPK